jgi:hypothetical protein
MTRRRINPIGRGLINTKCSKGEKTDPYRDGATFGCGAYCEVPGQRCS